MQKETRNTIKSALLFTAIILFAMCGNSIIDNTLNKMFNKKSNLEIEYPEYWKEYKSEYK